jgi:hypothetical protein
MEKSVTEKENGAAARERVPPLRIKSRAAITGGGEARY